MGAAELKFVSFFVYFYKFNALHCEPADRSSLLSSRPSNVCMCTKMSQLPHIIMIKRLHNQSTDTELGKVHQWREAKMNKSREIVEMLMHKVTST